MTAHHRFNPPTVAGAGGGGKAGKAGSGGGYEAPNTLRSSQVARVIDLLGEGPIVGLENGFQDCWLDGVQVQNSDGTYNFNSFEAQMVWGWPDNPLMAGFASQQAEFSVGLQLKSGKPITRTVNNADVDRVRITVSVPALQAAVKSNGNVFGTGVSFQIWLQSGEGGWQYLTELSIEGKTNSRYQRSYVLTAMPPPYDIRLIRTTPDSDVQELQNDLYWDAYTEIIDARVNYTNSACFGWTIDAEQFQAIPKRVYRPKGLFILIPNNYDPIARTYAGVWDGGFIYAWSNNPAWVYHDLVTQGRYGLGDFISAAEVDKWALYKIAQWCDGFVPDGRGGYEPRFVCNAVIASQQEAFDLLQSFASIFRGFAYWAGGQLVPVADMPGDPIGLYTNANVVEGQFTYAGADFRARHTQVMVAWNDPANLGERRIAIVEDQDAIALYGIIKTDLIAIGCTSESQAIRAGKWLLYTEAYEAETVSFATGLEGAWCRPGDIIQISDVTVGGERRGGRIVAATTQQITLDGPVVIGGAPGSAMLSVMMPGGSVATRAAYLLTPGEHPVIYVDPPFSVAPLPDSVWVLASTDLNPTLWRVTATREGDGKTYQITGLQHRPDKWAHIEYNLALSEPDISNIGAAAIIALNAMDYLVALSAISVGVRMLISWTSTAPLFEVAYRLREGNWTRIRTDQTALDVEAFDGPYDIWVTGINAAGFRGPTAKIKYTVIGLSAPPLDAQNFRIQVVQGVAMFQWAPATDLDVIIGGSYEMRYSPRTAGATWATSNTVITSIPGNATTVELPYRPGTYFLRPRDITGLFSPAPSVITTSGPDTAYRNYARICEHPDWLGDKQNVEVLSPQEWLILGVTGGLWDDQLDAIDLWPDVDVLPEGASGPAPPYGVYDFYNRIDIGAVFPVRLTLDMLAFPFIPGGANMIDGRLGLVDSWQDWDNSAEDGAGMVSVRVRQTNDDPLSPAANWSSWSQFTSGEFTARAYEFQAVLAAPIGQNVAIEQLCILADISAKVDQAADLAWVSPKMRINFHVKFYSLPSISIAIQQGIEGDNFRITNKTREYFDLELLNSAGAPITGVRTIDWIASGY